MQLNPSLLESYYYDLPKEQIASFPLANRKDAKLLLYKSRQKSIAHHRFSDFYTLIPKNCTLIFNNTKVIKARFYARKLTKSPQQNMQDSQKSSKLYECLYHRHIDSSSFLLQMRGKVRLGDCFCLEDSCLQSTDSQVLHNTQFFFKVTALLENGLREAICMDKNQQILNKQDLLCLLEKIGQIPIPPYLGRNALSDEEKEYQSPFAQKMGAIAAPTASLHFSEADKEWLKNEFKIAFVTLHIGAGTFMSVESEKILEHKMHTESFEIPQESANIFDSNQELLPIGTTALRVLEEYMRNHRLQGESNLFLNPYNRPLRAKNLLTNFHLPKSTLLMLVASMVGLEETHRIYAEAIKQNYRFYSYGDAMLILNS